MASNESREQSGCCSFGSAFTASPSRLFSTCRPQQLTALLRHSAHLDTQGRLIRARASITGPAGFPPIEPSRSVQRRPAISAGHEMTPWQDFADASPHAAIALTADSGLAVSGLAIADRRRSGSPSQARHPACKASLLA